MPDSNAVGIEMLQPVRRQIHGHAGSDRQRYPPASEGLECGPGQHEVCDRAQAGGFHQVDDTGIARLS
jgi:hypothetical protein